MTAYIFNVHVC